MDIKVSVIIPIYNVENYLEQCLDSILKQTLKEIEIICVNDGSNDSSERILERYQKTDNRVIVVNKSNAGYGAACNTGLRLAQGEYISIIESDDFIHTDMLNDLYNLAVKNNVDVAKSAFYEYQISEQKGKEDIKKINWSEEYNMPTQVFKINDCAQLIYFHPSIWSCLYKKEFLEQHKIKFVEAKGAGWVDNPFQIQTLCLAERIIYTDKAYYYYRLDNPSSSSNIVNISNPFDRSDEVHEFIERNKIQNNNILAHLYKREFAYIDLVINSIKSEFFEFAGKKINQMISRMNSDVIYKNKHINNYEKNLYETCKTKDGIISLLEKAKNINNNITMVKAD